MSKILNSVMIVCFIALVVTLILPVSPSEANIQVQGYSLTSAVIFDTVAYPADGAIREMTWKNDTGDTLYIRKAYLWIGMYHGARADSDATVMRQGDGAIVAKMQWDHYAEPTGPTSQVFNFEPGYIALEAGDSLMLRYYTNPIIEQPPFMAASQFIMWWSRE